ncbi:MAG: lysostaphin resistance A-like protein [Oscillospiraceae bacterium]
MVYYNNYNNFNQYDYNMQMMQMRRNEKYKIRTAATKLGIIMIAYILLSTIFQYIFYFVSYAYLNHHISLNMNTIISYLRSNQDIVNSAAFNYSANIFIVGFSLLITLLIATSLLDVEIGNMISFKNKPVKTALTWFPVCMIVNMIFSTLINIVTLIFGSAGFTIPQSDFSVTNTDTASIILQFLYIVILGPIAEELIYRGVILSILKPYGKWAAVIISALFFGLMHGNIPQAVPAFCGAIVYGLIAVRFNSIIPTIIIHMLNNGLTMYTDFASALHWPEAPYYAVIIGIILIGFYIMLTRMKELKISQQVTALTTGQKVSTIIFSPAIIIYLLMLLYRIVKFIVSAN